MKKAEIAAKGDAGESALNAWFAEKKLSCVAICQSKETFSSLFSPHVKRPDFLVLLESLGLIAVDAKNYKLSAGVFTLELESELRRSVAFERLFRISVWYAYFDESAPGKSWYWISALKAIEVGEVRHNKSRAVDFLAIKRQHFEHLTEASDLAKLYTHRLPSTSSIANLPLSI